MCCGAPAPLRRTTRRLSSAPWILRTDVSRVDRSPIERGSVSTSGGAWGGSTPIFDSSARNHQHLWPCHRDSAKTGCDTSGGTHDRASRRRASAPQGCCRCTPTSRPARDAGATSSSSAQTVGTAPHWSVSRWQRTGRPSIDEQGTHVRTCLSGSRLHSSNAGRMSWYSHSRKPSPGLLILSSVLGGSSIARSFWRIAASERMRRPTPSSDLGFFVVQWSMSYQLSNAPARRNWLSEPSG